MAQGPESIPLLASVDGLNRGFTGAYNGVQRSPVSASLTSVDTSKRRRSLLDTSLSTSAGFKTTTDAFSLYMIYAYSFQSGLVSSYIASAGGIPALFGFPITSISLNSVSIAGSSFDGYVTVSVNLTTTAGGTFGVR